MWAPVSAPSPGWRSSWRDGAHPAPRSAPLDLKPSSLLGELEGFSQPPAKGNRPQNTGHMKGPCVKIIRFNKYFRYMQITEIGTAAEGTRREGRRPGLQRAWNPVRTRGERSGCYGTTRTRQKRSPGFHKARGETASNRCRSHLNRCPVHPTFVVSLYKYPFKRQIKF